jgi:hypothetical protein
MGDSANIFAQTTAMVRAVMFFTPGLARTDGARSASMAGQAGSVLTSVTHHAKRVLSMIILWASPCGDRQMKKTTAPNAVLTNLLLFLKEKRTVSASASVMRPGIPPTRDAAARILRTKQRRRTSN